MFQQLRYGTSLCIVLVAMPLMAQPRNVRSEGLAQQPNNLQHCRLISNPSERLRCYEKEATDQTQDMEPAVEGGWRLVRTPNPKGGPDAVSIMRTADLGQSDADLAGLVVRCAPQGQEVLVVVIQPLPPGAQPQVDIGPAGSTVTYTATVLPPGLEILLPADAAMRIQHQWERAPELSMVVDEGQIKVRGAVPIAGLQAAFQLLLANCSL